MLARQRRCHRQIAIALMKVQLDFVPELDGHLLRILPGRFAESVDRKVACRPGTNDGGSGGSQNQDAKRQDQSDFKGVKGSDIQYSCLGEFSDPSLPDVVQAVPGPCQKV